MLVWEVAKKYSNALFLSVKEKGIFDQADAQMLALKQVVDGDRRLLNFLTAPQVSDEAKQALVKDVFEQRMERLLVEFLQMLVRKNRINYLPEIIEEFDRHVKAEKGISSVTAITAVPMTEAEKSSLSARLAAKTAMKIELRARVDASIIGGMILIMHNQIIDGSVQHGLNELQDQLGSVRVH